MHGARLVPLVTFLAALLPFGCGPTGSMRIPGGASVGQPIRIGILEGERTVTVESSSTISVTVGPGVLHGTSFQLASTGDEITISGSGGSRRGRKVECESDAPIRVNGSGYRGGIEIVHHSGGLTVVNEVGLEDYLKGVVPREIGYLKSDEIEAMKAQAVAARTYTVAHLGRRASRGFDLYDDTRDQVYGGVAAESEVGNRAVEETGGKVMVYEGKYVQAFFHSTCGGATVNIEDVWESERVPYLRSVLDTDDRGFHCEPSPHFRWTEVYSPQEAQDIVSGNLSSVVSDAPRSIGRLREVAVERQSPSGRAQVTRFSTELGTWRVHKDKLRSVLRRPTDGTPLLRSSYVRVFNDQNAQGHLLRLTVSGAGNGHGIGMCQWGAIGMARKGYSYDQIVGHYYSGVGITDYQGARIAATMSDAPAGEG